jgi:hypothetical protein
MTFSNLSVAEALMAEVDALWARCETGISIAYPATDATAPEKRQRAARLLVRLMDEAREKEQAALTLDPTAVQAWAQRREALYQEKGWNWPPNPEVAKAERLELVQLAWGEV